MQTAVDSIVDIALAIPTWYLLTDTTYTVAVVATSTRTSTILADRRKLIQAIVYGSAPSHLSRVTNSRVIAVRCYTPHFGLSLLGVTLSATPNSESQRARQAKRTDGQSLDCTGIVPGRGSGQPQSERVQVTQSYPDTTSSKPDSPQRGAYMKRIGKRQANAGGTIEASSQPASTCSRTAQRGAEDTVGNSTEKDQETRGSDIRAVRQGFMRRPAFESRHDSRGAHPAQDIAPFTIIPLKDQK